MTVRVSRITPICIAVLVLAGCGQEDRPDPAEAAKRPALLADRTWPNVLLISIDSLRPDHLHCYGYPKETSPHLDQLAREGARFENVISSSSWSLPAHGCMFTGLVDSIHGCTDASRRVRGVHYTLAERLKDVGYATAGFFSGPYLHPAFGLAQGFETYVDCMSYPEPNDQSADASGTAEDAASGETDGRDVTSPKIVEEVRGWLEDNTRRPFFMFVHMWDVHFDYTPPPPYDTRFDPDYTGKLTGVRFLSDPRINPEMPQRDLEHLLGLYDGEIAWTDEHFGQIVDEFRTRELLNSTIVIVTSGHGTAFFEHELKGHRNSLYDEVVRIPLIIRYPARILPEQRYEQQVRMIDLLPTVIDMLGMPSANLLMGQTLAPLFAGGSTERDEPAISELLVPKHKLRSFRRPDRKTLWRILPDTGTVYDLSADPGELAPLQENDRSSPTAKAARADVYWSRKFLKSFRERYPQPPKTAELPAELVQKLQSLVSDHAVPPGNSQPAP